MYSKRICEGDSQAQHAMRLYKLASEVSIVPKWIEDQLVLTRTRTAMRICHG